MRFPNVVLIVLGFLAQAGIVCAASVENATKPAKPGKQRVVQRQDGQIVRRIDLPASSLPNISSAHEVWVERTLDPAWMARMAKDPRLAAQWLDAVTEPRVMTALATMAAQPESYPRTMGNFFRPDTLRNWSEVPTPAVMLSWMAAGMDPRSYLAIFNRLTDPAKLRRWAGCAVPSSAPQAQAALQTWLKLPAADTRKNPWLADVNITSY